MLIEKNKIFSIDNFRFEYPNNTYITVPQNIDIYQGDIVLLTGKSGTGKSTFLHILKGLIPTFIPGHLTGTIEYNSKNLFAISAQENSKIALLWQNPEAQFINSTVFRELALSLENIEYDDAQIVQKINNYAQKFHIEHLLDKTVDELSGGEKQKINLVALLLADPDVLLLDEPTAFLDPESAKTLIETLKGVAFHRDKTIIIIEHNVHYFKSLINKHLRMNDLGELNEESLESIQWYPEYALQPYINPELSHSLLFKITHYERKNHYLIENFEIFDNEIIGIIGKNGIGKSTLLKKIAKLSTITQNAMYYKEKDISSIKRKEYFRDLALLFQNSEHHFIYNTVAEEINNSNLQKQAGLHGKLNQNPFSLSEGQKRRLAIAIMWNLDRTLYLLDEPTFGQDMENKVLLQKMIFEMNATGKTFIIVSHDLPFLLATCNKIFKFTAKGLTLHHD